MSLHKKRVIDSTNAYNIDEDVVDELIRAKEIRDEWKDDWYNVAVLNITADLLNAPHIQYIQLVNAQLHEILNYPHKLMVWVEYDGTTEQRKWKHNIYNHRERQYIMQNIKWVDHAFINWSNWEQRPYPTNEYLSPDVLVSHKEYYPTEESMEYAKQAMEKRDWLFLVVDDINKPRLLNQENMRDKWERSTTNTIKQIIKMYRYNPKYW